MKKVKYAIAFVLALTILMAGCLGGDEDKKDKAVEYTTAKGTTGAEGDVEADVTGPPQEFTETVDIPIGLENLTAITFQISVEDGQGENSDASTNPDEVSGSLDSSGFNETLPEGKTPYQATINVKAPEGENLPSGWTLTLTVVCHPGNDRWPGPGIWYGVPDNGFSYNVTVEYTYLTPMT
ncbi:MAG: hypothetical protein JSW00_09530 [Thermoplasmata archaeon]|nr:MAG: hypothetical protein JSW00_09530 [Thermoplasmata archaeon]